MLAATAPTALTSFIGRDEEVAALRRLLDTARLLTLTGAGGSGKTRLASEVAVQSATRFPDGVVWVELAPLLDPELLANQLLAALGVEQGQRTPMLAVLDTVRDRRMLLVLDNCEHLVDACAALAEALLHGCPRLQILATSREALGVGGERAWLVPGLAVPGNGRDSHETISESGAVRLFVDRAQAALATFQLTPANVDAVVQICRRLDGLPLAIELAAARVRAIPPEQLAARLDDSFRILTSGARTAVPRHRTLREAIDWSYNLLDERERTLLQRLSTFAGDFTLEAAESVGADVNLDSADVLDTLGALVDKSLVVMREVEGTARYFLLETIRQYAYDRLKESGNLALVCGCHAKTYIDLVDQAAPHLITRDRPEWVRRIQQELDNIRVALACTRAQQPSAYLYLAGRLGWFWYSSGLWSEGRRWLESAMTVEPNQDTHSSRAAVLRGAGGLAALQGDFAAAIPWLEESARIYRSLGDRGGEAYALAYHGVCYGQTGDERTVAPTREALAWFRGAGDLYGLRLCLLVLAVYHGARGEIDAAREAGEEGVAVAREFGLDRELAIALLVLASVQITIGHLGHAAGLLRESLSALRRDPSLFWTARALQLLALVTFRLGRAERGAYLMGAAEALRETIGAGFLGHDRDRLLPVMTAARQAMGDAAFDGAWKAGRARPLDDVVNEAVAEATPGESEVASHESTQPTTAAALALDVRALGMLQIVRGGAPLPGDAWRYARPRELLIFLLSHPDGCTRDQIGLVFWPDASATQVKNNFHVMLHHVRRAIGRADLIAFDKERYRIAWELGVRFDARTFEELMRSATRALRSARPGTDMSDAVARLGEAMSLYRGDFLADQDVGDWHIEIRDRLRRLYSDGVLLLGARRLEQGAYMEAAEAFRRAIAVDELHEEAHRRLMLSLARAGERTEALRQYDRLARTLRADLETEPDAETKALYERLRSAEAI